MKIGIITFHASFNYGSMLQAWALQSVLLRCGHFVEIINLRTKEQKLLYSKPLCFSSFKRFKRSLKYLLFKRDLIKPLEQKWELFDSFMNQNMLLTKEYSNVCELHELRDCYDVVITGSDQIWNVCAADFSEAYFANFVSNSVRKVAYAPSMGPLPELIEPERVEKYLKDYYAISVREARTKDFLIKNGVAEDISTVVDPTMLLQETDYELFFEKKPIFPQEYIFYYTPGGARHEFLEMAEMLGVKFGKKVVCENVIDDKQKRLYPHVVSYPVVGPREFLNLIKHASLVCGASFHLMVFAILFEKKFYCFNGNVDSRMNYLMKIAGLEERIISRKEEIDELDDLPIDFHDAHLRINKEREKSMNFLKHALKR